MQFFKEARVLFSTQQYCKAEEKYSQCIDKISQLPDTEENITTLSHSYNDRGQIKYLRVDFKEAIDDYTLAINTRPNFHTAFYNRGQIHYRLGRYTLAIKDLEQTLKLKPDFNDAQDALKTARLEQSINGDKIW